MIKLSPQQEKFAQEIFSGKSQRQAYLVAYPSSTKWKPEDVDSNASQLASDTKVIQRLTELRKPIIAKYKKTAEDLIKELDEIKQSAYRDEQYSPAINAIMGQAKLLGLDKQVIEGAVTVVTMAMVKKDGKPLKYNIGKEIKK
jgi:Rps23 Pro-64 3,4-dihydroxylase Tpa1-like proline 4-hydroxylase